MVMPAASAELCPQCGADVRSSGSRCPSCGFWLPSAPAPRTGPPLARPVPLTSTPSRATPVVIGAVGAAVLLLLTAGALLLLRRPDEVAPPRVAALAASEAPPPAAPARLEPDRLLSDARRQASEWHQDAVLVSLSASPLDAVGVAPSGEVEIIYARPAGARISGGAEASGERFVLRSSGGALTGEAARAAKSQIAPEPNCVFDDAWAAAKRAGADPAASLRLRYQWSEKHARPVWEVLGARGEVLRRVDGGSCSILTR